MNRKTTIRLGLLVLAVAALTALVTLAASGWFTRESQQGSSARPNDQTTTFHQFSEASPTLTGTHISSDGPLPNITQTPKITSSVASSQSSPIQTPMKRTITVYNKVTDGATQMREDAEHPAYLSTEPRNFCKSRGCALPGTDVGSGAQLVATCQKQGERTTNGNDTSSADDSNPGLYESTTWYGVRLNDGRLGYISDVWIQPSDRGGLAGC